MESLDNRHECCGIRKVEPLGRVLAELDAWVTGLRREQSVTRADAGEVELDGGHGGIAKLNPIIGWTEAELWAYADATGCPSTRCTSGATPRSAARRARAPSSRANTRAPAAGGGRTPRARSAACTRSRARRSGRAAELAVTVAEACRTGGRTPSSQVAAARSCPRATWPLAQSVVGKVLSAARAHRIAGW